MFSLLPKSYYLKPTQRGFTLIELLIVISIIAILAGVVFVSLDPLTRFRDARDASRWTGVTALLSAIKVDQVDNRGPYAYGLRFYDSPAQALTPDSDVSYQISNATTTTDCNLNCSEVVSADQCVNLLSLIDEGYLGKVPVNPSGTGSWDEARTGYYLSINDNGSATVGSCDAESLTPIEVTR